MVLRAHEIPVATPCRQRRSFMTGVAVSGYIYVLGGDDSGGTRQPPSITQKLTPTVPQVHGLQMATPLPVALDCHTSATANVIFT